MYYCGTRTSLLNREVSFIQRVLKQRGFIVTFPSINRIIQECIAKGVNLDRYSSTLHLPYISGEAILIFIRCERLESLRLPDSLVFIIFISEKLLSMDAVEMGIDKSIQVSVFKLLELCHVGCLAIKLQFFALCFDTRGDNCISCSCFTLQTSLSHNV